MDNQQNTFKTGSSIVTHIYSNFNHAPSDEMLMFILKLLGKKAIDNSVMRKARQHLRDEGFVFTKQPDKSWTVSIDKAYQKTAKKKSEDEQRKNTEQLTIKMEQERIEREKKEQAQRQIEEDIKVAQSMLIELEAKLSQLRG